MLAQFFPLLLYCLLHSPLATFCRHCIISGLEEELLLLSYLKQRSFLSGRVEGSEVKVTYRPLTSTPLSPFAASHVLPFLRQ